MAIKRFAVFTMLVALWLFTAGASQAQSDTATTFKTLHSFNGADGELVYAGLLQAKNGKLYGTTYYGGANNSGEIFQITPTGALSILHSLCSKNDCTDGEYSYAVPVEGADGNFYGTTFLGGTGDDGIVFKVTPTGAFTTLHAFRGNDGSQPQAGLVAATDGNFYGTTYMGGQNNKGTVFKVTPRGAFTLLHSFCSEASCTDGLNPFADLIQGKDGNLYGTTLGGGAHDDGTVFKITTSGAFTVLYSLCSQSGCADGEFPQTGLVQASNGNLYGSTILGGAYGSGTIFELTAGGTFTTLYSACSESGCPDGNYLYDPLMQGKDGNLYGIMQIGGAHNNGTVFRITLTGSLTRLYSFCSQPSCADGQYPAGGLVQGANGMLYGTTADGGAHGDGTVFSIAP